MITVLSAVLRQLTVLPVTIIATERRGIPRLEWIGVPTKLAKMWKQKIGVLAHTLQLPLKSKIVSVSVSPSLVEVDGVQVELAVLTAVLALLNNQEQALEAFYVGEVSLDGTVSGGAGLVPIRKLTSLLIISGPNNPAPVPNAFSVSHISELIGSLKTKTLQSAQHPEIDPPDTTLHSQLFAKLSQLDQEVIALLALSQVGAICLDWPAQQVTEWGEMLLALRPSSPSSQNLWLQSMALQPAQAKLKMQESHSLIQLIHRDFALTQLLAKTNNAPLIISHFELLSANSRHLLLAEIERHTANNFSPFPFSPQLLISSSWCTCGRDTDQACHCSRKVLDEHHRSLANWQSLCPTFLPAPNFDQTGKTDFAQVKQKIEQKFSTMKMTASPAERLSQAASLLSFSHPNILKIWRTPPSGYS